MSRHVHPVASIVFDHRDPVDPAIATLMEHGIARDQIEVVTDLNTAEREFGALAHRMPFNLIADTGRGALIGLLISFFLSLILVMISPLNASPTLAIVQLLGPNVGTLTGAVIGAVVGYFRPRAPSDAYCRVRKTGGILMVVHCHTRAEAQELLTILSGKGGHDGIVDQVA